MAGSELKWSRTWAKSVAEESSQPPSQRMLIIEFLYEEGESWTHYAYTFPTSVEWDLMSRRQFIMWAIRICLYVML